MGLRLLYDTIAPAAISAAATPGPLRPAWRADPRRRAAICRAGPAAGLPLTLVAVGYPGSLLWPAVEAGRGEVLLRSGDPAADDEAAFGRLGPDLLLLARWTRGPARRRYPRPTLIASSSTASRPSAWTPRRCGPAPAPGGARGRRPLPAATLLPMRQRTSFPGGGGVRAGRREPRERRPDGEDTRRRRRELGAWRSCSGIRPVPAQLPKARPACAYVPSVMGHRQIDALDAVADLVWRSPRADRLRPPVGRPRLPPPGRAGPTACRSSIRARPSMPSTPPPGIGAQQPLLEAEPATPSSRVGGRGPGAVTLLLWAGMIRSSTARPR